MGPNELLPPKQNRNWAETNVRILLLLSLELTADGDFHRTLPTCAERVVCVC